MTRSQNEATIERARGPGLSLRARSTRRRPDVPIITVIEDRTPDGRRGRRGPVGREEALTEPVCRAGGR